MPVVTTIVSKRKFPDLTIVTSSDGTKVQVSRGTVTYRGEMRILDDDVEYQFLTGVDEDRITFGYLVMVKSTGVLDVYVEELYRDSRIALHDWREDHELEPILQLFQIQVYSTGEARVVLWVPEV